MESLLGEDSRNILFKIDIMLAGRQGSGSHASTSGPIPIGTAKLFDIAKIYGGKLDVVPPKPGQRTATTPRTAKPASPPRSTARVSTAGNKKPSGMLDVEMERLEALKRKNDREMQKLIEQENAYERRMAEADLKVAKAKAREEERQRQRRLEAERARLEADERLAARREEEAAKEEELRRLAKQSYEREQAVLEEKQRQAQEAAKLAAQREVERYQRLEQLKAQTAAILAEQAAEVERRKAEMEARDRERAVANAQRRKETERLAQEKREAFEARIAQARERNAQLLEEKRRDFEAREAAAAVRAQALAHAREEEALLRAEIEAEKTAHMAAVAAEGAAAEALRKSELIEKRRKFEERAQMLAEEKERELRELKERAQQLEAERQHKLENLKQYRENQAEQLGSKIDQDTQRARAVNQQKNELRNARKIAATRASLARKAMKEEMEMARRKRWAMQHPGSPFDAARKAQNRPTGVHSLPSSPRKLDGEGGWDGGATAPMGGNAHAA